MGVAVVGVAAVGLLDNLIQLVPGLDVTGFWYAPDNVCDNPVSLGCLLSDAGAAGAGAAAGAAAAGYWQPGAAPARAAEPPAGYNPPAGQTGHDAINDPAFQAQRDQYERDHSDKRPPPPAPGLSDQLMDNFWGDVRGAYGRQ